MLNPTEHDELLNSNDFGDQMVPQGCFGLLGSVLADGGDRFAVCSTAFDTNEEITWMGNSGGHVTSYYGNGLEKYTSFQVHPTHEIRQILTPDVGVLSLTKNHLKCNTRQGLNVFNFTSSSFADVQCMCFSPRIPNSLIIGGYQQSLSIFDVHRAEETKNISFRELNCAVLRANDKFVFSGDTNGKIAMRNLNTLQTMQIFDAHSGTLSDFDICGTKLVTCGFSNRSGVLQCDRFLMIYDLRTLRALSPVPLPFDPYCLRFLPTYTDSRLLVASQTGQFQVLELGASNCNAFIHQVETQGTLIFSMDVSSSKQCVNFGDGAGVLHLFSDRANPVINECARPTDFPDVVVPMQPVALDDDSFSYSLVPMPFPPNGGRLLSDWPQHLCRRVYRKPLPIDPDIMKAMKVTQFVGYAPNPINRLPNQVPYDLKNVDSKRKMPKANVGGGVAASGKVSDDEANASSLPKHYCKAKYAKMANGIDDPSLNETQSVGLEATTPNSYVNALLLILFHIEPLRNALMSHLCRKEFCLACELAFLFHMLDLKAVKQPRTSNNFVRAFRSIPEATALGLVLNDRDEAVLRQTNLATLIQSFNRFVVRQLSAELSDLKSLVKPPMSVSSRSDFLESISETPAKIAPAPVESPEQLNDSAFGGESSTTESESLGCGEETTIVEKLFASKTAVVARCKCGFENVRDNCTMVVELNYSAFVQDEQTSHSFEEVFVKSLQSEQTTHAWCEKCAKFQPTVQSKKIFSLPDVVSVSCNVATDKDKEFWANQCKALEENAEGIPPPPWVDSNFVLQLKENGAVEYVHNENGEDVSDQCKVYKLTSVVALISDNDDQHLVACVKNATGDEWTVFNDAVVTHVSQSDAISFDVRWKVPCLLFFCAGDLNETHFVQVSAIDERVFALDECLSVRRRLSSSTFVPLDAHEMPKKGDMVALDAEFVTLNQEEAEFHSDGTKLTIKPSHMSLARVTCIRGNGPLEGVPFIDDYISTQEEVVDYLTKFSGIKPGDLTPSMTSKHLTTLKSTYLKLRYLIDNGVTFVGHGLNNDFKVINIVVPPVQCIDTVHLFHLPHHRMISLRFLAWHLLGMNIQSETHDSVEDTRTALKLYKKYVEVRGEGESNFARLLGELYEKGRTHKWKINANDIY